MFRTEMGALCVCVRDVGGPLGWNLGLAIFQLNDPESDSPNKKYLTGFPGGAVVGSPPANAGDTGSCPGPGKSHMPRSG